MKTSNRKTFKCLLTIANAGLIIVIFLLTYNLKSHRATGDRFLINDVGSNEFVRGDFDNNGLIDITDVLLLLQYLILGDGEVICADASDANDDGLVDVTDALFTLLVIFNSGEIPAPGMFECGEDPSDDEIGCGNYRAPCM